MCTTVRRNVSTITAANTIAADSHSVAVAKAHHGTMKDLVCHEKTAASGDERYALLLPLRRLTMHQTGVCETREMHVCCVDETETNNNE